MQRNDEEQSNLACNDTIIIPPPLSREQHSQPKIEIEILSPLDLQGKEINEPPIVTETKLSDIQPLSEDKPIGVPESNGNCHIKS